MDDLLVPLLVLVAAFPSSAFSQQHQTSHVDSIENAWEREARHEMAAERWDDAIQILRPVLTDSPGELQARLLNAICHREKARITFYYSRVFYFLDAAALKKTRTASRAAARGRPWHIEVGKDYDVTRAIFDFEFVIAQDSSFGDALLEYARLWHDHEVLDVVIELREAQISIKPDFVDAHEELIAAYRHYIAWTRQSEALRWLEQRRSAYATYFIGEIHRRNGRLARAEAIFEELQQRETLPAQPILLSRARVRIQQKELEAAYAFIEQALRFESVLEAHLLLTDFYHVMSPWEYDESMILTSADEYAAFIDRMWTRRDPIPASRINWRLIEHYRRLIVAERDFEYFGPRLRKAVKSDDAQRYLDSSMFPPAYWSAHGFNDKGLIYIRYGEPDERVWTQPDMGISMNESWRYRAEELDFHFLIPDEDGIAYSWPLVPLLTECNMANDRRHWGGFYSQIAPVTQFVQTSEPGRSLDPCVDRAEPRHQHDMSIATAALADAGNKAIARGLTTDRHTWPEGAIEGFDFPFDVATFRGADGQTDVGIYLALPVGYFSDGASSDTMRVELGLALHDTTLAPAVNGARTMEFARTGDRTKAAFESLHFTVPPDSYHVSLHADLLESPLLAGYQFDRRIPDYSRVETMMSDVVLAYDVRPRPGHTPARRSSMQITANPFHRFAVDQPVDVYFELYHLTLSENDVARYQITYQIEPEKKKRGILGLFRRNSQSLSVTTNVEESTASPLVFSQIDVSELEPGGYTLVVRVVDAGSGKELVRRLPLELTEGRS